MGKKVLVVCAHPDDEVLGVGGVIARHILLGDEVNIMFMTDGLSSRDSVVNSDSINFRRLLAYKACAVLGVGVESLTFFKFSDNSMDKHTLLDIVKSIESKIRDYSPYVIYTHHSSDLNIDHRLTYQAVMTACRPVPQFCVKEIYSFEVLSSTNWATAQHNNFVPNYYVDISTTIEMKIKALEVYDNEMRKYPNARSYEAIKALSLYRGTTVGYKSAEAFFVERILA
jgi:LmbE family N-acetylglucosaminyl deacetylase